MTNDRSVYILIDQWQNVYWPIIGRFYCMMSFFIDTASGSGGSIRKKNYIEVETKKSVTKYNNLH